MKSLIAALILTVAFPDPGDTLSVMFWNLENFFDWRDSGQNESDAEFSSSGPKRWTKKRFLRKCELISKTVLLAADTLGGLPDVIGFAEVENSFVLRRLLEETTLRKAGYSLVHYDSPDPRGIDVALLFRKERLDTVFTFPSGIEGLKTRDMLVAAMRRADARDSAAFIICHHPSKYGGKISGSKREMAVSRLCALSDSLSGAGWGRQIAIGDFNDSYSSEAFLPLAEMMISIARPGTGAPGSIRFAGKWELIDLCFVRGFSETDASFKIFPVPFLTVRDRTYSGEKPLRTYSGPRYLGGVSDHYPILVRLFFY